MNSLRRREKGLSPGLCHHGEDLHAHSSQRYVSLTSQPNFSDQTVTHVDAIYFIEVK